MVVRETRADGHVYLETSRWCVEVQLGCFEWIILMKFQQPMIVSSLVRWMKTVQAEVELQVAYPSHEGILQWIPLEFCRFFLQTQECKFLSHCYFIIKGSITYSKWRKREGVKLYKNHRFPAFISSSWREVWAISLERCVEAIWCIFLLERVRPICA